MTKDARSIAKETLAVFAVCLAVLVLCAVSVVRSMEEHTQETAQTFKLACEATGGKPVWNQKYWECLK